MSESRSLTTPERKRLAQYEATIRQGLGNWMDVSRALIAIHAEELYVAKAGTFEAYCKDEFGISRPRAYQLIESFKAADDVSTVVDKANPPSERVARELSKVETEQDRASLWVKAIKTAPKNEPTAAHVAKIREELFPPADKEPDYRAELKKLIGRCESFRLAIDEVVPYYKPGNVAWQQVLDSISSAEAVLKGLL